MYGTFEKLPRRGTLFIENLWGTYDHHRANAGDNQPDTIGNAYLVTYN
jgi:hypothetical protein